MGSHHRGLFADELFRFSSGAYVSLIAAPIVALGTYGILLAI